MDKFAGSHVVFCLGTSNFLAETFYAHTGYFVSPLELKVLL